MTTQTFNPMDRATVVRLDTGVKVTHLHQFDRKEVDGKVLILRDGDNERFSRIEVKLNTDLPRT
ncbi:MAG: hypothetical protein EXS30_01975 [Pedosphaera sp.]|nr:hypothetical protein [Pedosphaera sp.]